MTENWHPRMNWLKRIPLEILVIISIMAIVWLVASHQPAPAPAPAQTQIATPAPVLVNTPIIDMALSQPLKVYGGGAKTKSKLKLPEHVTHNPQQQVIAASRIDNRDDHPRTITTVVDADTGTSTTYVTQEPLPWLAVDTRGGLGIYAGIKNGQQTARLQLRQDLLQVKNMHIGAIASLDQPVSGPASTDYFVGIGAELRW